MSVNETLTIKLPPGETERPEITPTVPVPQTPAQAPQTATPHPVQPAPLDGESAGTLE